MNSLTRCLLGALTGGAVGAAALLVFFAYPVLQQMKPDSPTRVVLALGLFGLLCGAVVGGGISLLRMHVERKEGL